MDFFFIVFCNSLASLNESKCEKKIVVPKMSSRNVIGVIGGRLNDEKVNKFDADTHIKQCQERLQNDPNYKQSHYDMDIIRCTVLKMPPNHVQNVQSRNADAGVGKDCSKIASNHDNDVDLEFFNDFVDYTPNHYENDRRNFDRFSTDTSMPMMNLATPESHSSFFF